MISLVPIILSSVALFIAVYSYLIVLKVDNDTDVKQIKKLLKNHQLRQLDIHNAQSQLQSDLQRISAQAHASLHKVGFHKFNPNRDTGGTQSFVLCLLDGNDSGVILTAVHGREATRVYAKQVAKGQTALTLSNEESQALSQALESRRNDS